MTRVAIRVTQSELEQARARMLDVFPGGFEECVHADGVELAGYVPSADADATSAALVGARLTEVAPGWETAWQRFHRPVQIGDLWLGPPWAEPPEAVTSVTILPGMAFGTGSHATTRLCIELLLEEEPTALVDLGCGSGILAVVGCALGFDPVIAVDIDPVAVDETREHARRNRVDVEVRHGEASVLDLPNPPLVTANLPLTELRRSVTALRPVRAIASGFHPGDIAEIPGYEVSERRERDGWEAVRLDRESHPTDE